MRAAMSNERKHELAEKIALGTLVLKAGFSMQDQKIVYAALVELRRQQVDDLAARPRLSEFDQIDQGLK